jgi:hypothetical protein
MNQRIIYPTPEGGVAVIIPSGELPIEEVAAKDVPEGVPYEIVSVDEIPTDRTFRGAWVLGDCCVEHDIDRCKAIGHDIRRSKRAEEFAPHDEVIAKQIPGVDAAAAEEARQEIRDKYAAIQEEIDAAQSLTEIKVALGLEQPAPEPEPEPVPEPEPEPASES